MREVFIVRLKEVNVQLQKFGWREMMRPVRNVDGAIDGQQMHAVSPFPCAVVGGFGFALQSICKESRSIRTHQRFLNEFIVLRVYLCLHVRRDGSVRSQTLEH
jgi:hypothetical protein